MKKYFKENINRMQFLPSALVLAAAVIAASLMIFRLNAGDYLFYIEIAIEKSATSFGSCSTYSNLYLDLVSLIIKVMQKLFTVNPYLVASLVNGFLEGLYALVVMGILLKLTAQERSKALYFLSICCIIFSSVPYFFFENTFYGHLHGINTWHNPTSIAVKPFVVLSFFLIVILFEYAPILKSSKTSTLNISITKTKKYLLFGTLTVSLLLMTFSKITGLAVIAPATFVFAICWWGKAQWSKTRLCYIVLIAALFIPSLILFRLQYFTYFPAESEFQVAFIGFDRLFSREAPDILLKVVWVLMLPIFITLTRLKTILQNKGFVLAWIAYFFAFAQRYMFEEIGPRFGHGNNTWGTHYAAILLLIMSVIEINRMWHEQKANTSSAKAFSFAIGVILMLFYTISGLIYMALVLHSGYYRV